MKRNVIIFSAAISSTMKRRQYEQRVRQAVVISFSAAISACREGGQSEKT